MFSSSSQNRSPGHKDPDAVSRNKNGLYLYIVVYDVFVYILHCAVHAVCVAGYKWAGSPFQDGMGREPDEARKFSSVSHNILMNFS